MKYYISNLGIILIALSLFSIGCSYGNTVAKKNTGDVNSTVEINNPSVSLADYLKQVPGVSVFGSGASAEINVRGEISKHGDTSPLFVVDGTRYGRSFARIQNISVSEIESVQVLKGIEASSAYGMQGAAGVVVIKMKKTD